MGLFDEITETNLEPHYNRCGVQKIFDQFESLADAEDLIRALKDNNIRGTKIATALKKRGYQVTGFTIQRHRRGVCSCSSE